MNVSFFVQSEYPNEYEDKKRPGTMVKQIKLCLVDLSPAPQMRCTDPVHYRLTEEEKVKFAGKLQDKRVTIGITGIQEWNSKVECSGKILEVEGQKADGK